MSAASATLTQADHDWKPKTNPWLIAFVVSLAAFMEVLDTSIANVALPHIAGNLGASQDQSTWVLTSYLVSNAIVLPISGWLVSVFGRKRFFMTCIVIFTISSLALRHRAQPGDFADRARDPGCGGRRAAADGAGHSGGYLSATLAWSRFLLVWSDGHLRAFDWTHARRLDHGQLHLAMDFPDEPAGGDSGSVSGLSRWWRIHRI